MIQTPGNKKTSRDFRIAAGSLKVFVLF